MEFFPLNSTQHWRLDLEFFTEILEQSDKIKMYQKEEKEHKKRVNKLKHSIEEAKKAIEKAEGKKEALLKRTELLKGVAASSSQRTSEALAYWREHLGFDIKEIANDSGDFDHYQFIYSKLQRKPTNSDVKDKENATKCSVGVKFHDNRLQIVNHDPPDILNPEQINELNEILTTQCVNTNSHSVDYKSAMVLIKRVLIKNLAR